MSQTNETYQIGSISDFSKIPASRLDDCLIAFKGFLNESSILMKELGDGFECCFLWTDDGSNEHGYMVIRAQPSQ